MRFNYDAYEKVFQAEAKPAPVIESAVETYKPTADEAKAMDKPGEAVMSATPDPIPEPEPVKAEIPTPTQTAEAQPEGGTNG